MGGGGSGEDWGHLYEFMYPMIPAAHRRCYRGSGEDWGHLSLAGRPMIKATHKRCYMGGGGEDWGHLSQPRCPMIPATHRRCYGKPFSSQVPHVTGHTQAVLRGEGVKIGDTFPKSGAPCYRPHTGGAIRGGGVGVKIGDTFPNQVPHDNGHTQAVLWDTFSKLGTPCYRPHTGGAMWGRG